MFGLGVGASIALVTYCAAVPAVLVGTLAVPGSNTNVVAQEPGTPRGGKRPPEAKEASERRRRLKERQMDNGEHPTRGEDGQAESTSYMEWADMDWSGWLFGSSEPAKVSDSASSSPRGGLDAGPASPPGHSPREREAIAAAPTLALTPRSGLKPAHSKLRASTRADGRMAQYGRTSKHLLNLRLSSRQWRAVADSRERAFASPRGATLIQSPRPQRTRSAAYLEEAGASGVDTAAAAAAAAAHAAAGPTVHAQPWREVQARGMGPVNGEVQPRAPLDSDRSNSTVERREKLERLYDSVKLEDRRARTNDGAIDTRLQRAQTEAVADKGNGASMMDWLNLQAAEPATLQASSSDATEDKGVYQCRDPPPVTTPAAPATPRSAEDVLAELRARKPSFRRGETASAKYERDSAYIHEMYVLVESPDRVLSDAASKAVLDFLDESKEAPLGEKRRARQQAKVAAAAH